MLELPRKQYKRNIWLMFTARHNKEVDNTVHATLA